MDIKIDDKIYTISYNSTISHVIMTYNLNDSIKIKFLYNKHGKILPELIQIRGYSKFWTINPLILFSIKESRIHV